MSKNRYGKSPRKAKAKAKAKPRRPKRRARVRAKPKFRCKEHGRSFKTKSGLASHKRGRLHRRKRARRRAKPEAAWTEWAPSPTRHSHRRRSSPSTSPKSRAKSKPEPAPRKCAFCDEDHGGDGHPFESWVDEEDRASARRRAAPRPFHMPRELKFRGDVHDLPQVADILPT